MTVSYATLTRSGAQGNRIRDFRASNGDSQPVSGRFHLRGTPRWDRVGDPEGSSVADPAGSAARKRHFMSKSDCPDRGRLDVDVPRLLMHPPARVPCEDPRPCDPRPPVTDMKQGNRHTGGRALVDALGIPRRRHRLPLPGESRLAALDALCDARGAVVTIPCRHEGGAANMAEACGKLTGRPGAVMVTRGSGARHAAAGLHTATARDSAPMVTFIGQVERATARRSGRSNTGGSSRRRAGGPSGSTIRPGSPGS